MKFTGFKNWLFERKEQSLSYGCIMMGADIPDWNKKISIINKKDIYEKDGDFGYEKEPHITILYGIHDNEVDRDRIYEEIERIYPIEATITQISIFENPEYDVVKFDIPLDEDLADYRKYFLMIFPNTQNFPEYRPHITIAYCIKGTGRKYVQNIEPFTVTFNTSIYSSPNDEKKIFELT